MCTCATEEIESRNSAGESSVGSTTDDLYRSQLSTTLETANRFKASLQETSKQIDSGFRSTMIMYQVAFYLGVVLILAAVGLAFTQGTSLLPLVFAGMGTLDVVAFFFTRPAQELQGSRAGLVQLQAAIYNWFFDYMNWNGLLIAQGDKGHIEIQDMKLISSILFEHTEKTLQMIRNNYDVIKGSKT